MNKLVYKLFIFGLFLSLISCDVIDGPFFENHDFGGNEIENPQKVLLIDFTGHTCKSCPKAHRTIDQIHDLYGEQVIPIAFHLGYFARAQSEGKFSTDFNTDEGSVLETFYEFVSFPIGLVNKLNKESLSPYANWASETATFIEDKADIAISASSEFTEATGIASVEIELTDVSASGLSSDTNLKLAVYLVESHIISWQKDEDSDPMDVEDYEHNHVFRDAIGSVWGEDISFDGSGEDGIKVSRSLEINQSWMADNCAFVIFVYNSASMEVVQVEQITMK